MLQAELKAQMRQFGAAKHELLAKMAEWSPLLHGNRDYLLCLAAAGPLLQFFAVRNGGREYQPVSEEFNMANALDCLRVSCKLGCNLSCCGGLSCVLHMLILEQQWSAAS